MAKLDDLIDTCSMDGTPIYNLSVVVDDHDMVRVTHVIRSANISATPSVRRRFIARSTGRDLEFAAYSG